MGSVPKHLTRSFRSLVNSSEVLRKYGFAGVLVVAGRGLSHKDHVEILTVESTYSDQLIELIVDAEKRALRRRFFAS